SGFSRAEGQTLDYRAQGGSSVTLPHTATGGGFTGSITVAHMPDVGSSGFSPASTSAKILAPSVAPNPHLGLFQIVINPNATLAANLSALAAFNRAAQQWAGFISDPITVTVDAGLGSLSAGVIGSTQSVILQAGYNTIRNAQVADADADDGI